MSGTTLVRRIIGVILLVVIGVIHLLVMKAGFHLQTYLGILFLLDAVGALVGAIWIALADTSTAWLLGGLVALAPLVGYIVTRTTALPGLHVLPWTTPTGLPLGPISLIVEALMVIVTLLTLMQPSKRLKAA